MDANANSQPQRDLTCVLVPLGQIDANGVLQTLRAANRQAALIRVAPLEAVKLLQVEVHDVRRGLPVEDPDLVGRLSKGGRAVFVHVNHSAKQAIIHGFADGKASEGFVGEPGEAFAARLQTELGTDLESILNADDGSRIGLGIAASRTAALLKGRLLNIPPGTPTALDSFVFHDRGREVEAGKERLAWMAFDSKLAFGTPGARLAQVIGSAPAGALGPLEGAKAEAVAALEALGEQTPADAKLTNPRALELCAFAAGFAFAGGDRHQFWDERVLPLFAICAADKPPAPVIDAEEAEELDDEETSMLAAMVETVPYAAPPGGESDVLAQLGQDELAPLAPWLTPEQAAGAMFALKYDRLLNVIRQLDGRRLGTALEAFGRAWYRALRPGQPEGDALANWRKAKDDEGKGDLDRFINDWAELRACLEIAALNKLDLALVFYA